MSHDRLRDRLSDVEGESEEGTAAPAEGSEAGQVSETDSLHGDAPIQPSDSVAGGPDGESGTTDEGPTGPNAPTFAKDQHEHPDKGDVETTG
jgi:hypothetical protein